MRNEKHSQLAGEQKVFQPQDGIAIQIVGRLIQQQRRRLAHQQAGKLQFDPFAAGEGLHELVTVKDVGGQAQPGSEFAQFAWRLVEKDGRRTEEVVGAERSLGFGKLLRQIRRAVPTGERAGNFDIAFDGRVACQHAQESRFAVAFLTDERKAFAVVQGNGKGIDQNGQVFAVGQGEMVYGQHRSSLSKKPSSVFCRRRFLRKKNACKKLMRKNSVRAGNSRFDRQTETSPQFVRAFLSIKTEITCACSAVHPFPIIIAPNIAHRLAFVKQIVSFDKMTAHNFVAFVC